MVIELRFLLVLLTTSIGVLGNDCRTENNTITCQQAIPHQLPSGITEVYILDWHTPKLTPQTFIDSRWATVKLLDITVLDNARKNPNVNIDAYVFQPLRHLKILGYHSPNVRHVNEQHTFTGLNNLTTLDLSDCIDINIDSVRNALDDTDLMPSLETLILNNVDSITARLFELNEMFFNMLYRRQIKHLSLSGMNLLIRNIYVLSSNTFALENLNISHCIYIDADISRTDAILTGLSKNLRTLDISFLYVGVTRVHVVNESYTLNCVSPPVNGIINFLALEQFYANGIFQYFVVDRVTIDISGCNVNWKLAHLSGNHMNKINITVKWPEDIQIYEIDLSHNQIEYLSPKALSGVHSMRNLFLSSNRLYLMEFTTEFPELFQNFTMLEHLTLQNNRLSKIPDNMFEKNVQLKMLYLGGNLLTAVTFETKQLKALKYLDLSGNLITTMDAVSRTRLDHLLSTYDIDSPKSDIVISDNPFKCSCANLDSLKWIVEFQGHSNGEFKCTFEDMEITIDTNAVEESWYQCYKTVIIIAYILTAVASIAIISLLTFIIVRVYRKHKREDEVKTFMKDYKRENTIESFLVMLSYSSKDVDIVLKHVYPTLEQHLRENVKLEKDIVCIGDKHFRPGRSIVEEMMNSIRDSCVTVFVVSISFCERGWCRMEVEEAYERGKPIILIFLEEVEPAVMPEHVREIFERQTRAKLIKDVEGQYQLKPSWTLLCQSILEFASKNYHQKNKAPCAETVV